MPFLKPDPVKHCAHCAARLARKRINGRMEDMAVFRRRRFCNRACMGAAMEKPVESLTRRGLLGRARKHLKAACENCGATSRLTIHHRDRDWRNNEPTNLATLCSSCHTTHHHHRGEIVPRARTRPCRYCGCMNKLTTCLTCQTRIRRYGKDWTMANGQRLCEANRAKMASQ